VATSAQTINEQVERVSSRRLLRAGALTLVSAVAANVVIGLIEGALGILPQDQLSFQPVGIVLSTTVQVGLGILVLALLGRFARRPISTFRIVALVALALSMLNPIAAGMGWIPDISVSLYGVFGLMVMHLVAGGIAIGVLTTQVQDR
jgi:Family of unknown function (DUF6069)